MRSKRRLISVDMGTLFVWLLLFFLGFAGAELEAEDQEGYDPLRASDRPKMFVDYMNGPLKGKTGLFVNTERNL